MKALYAIEWLESEHGWGTRPDGFSLHRSSMDATMFVKNYEGSQPKGYVPDSYSRAVTVPMLIEVSESVYELITTYGDVWMTPVRVDEYKTYDATWLINSRKASRPPTVNLPQAIAAEVDGKEARATLVATAEGNFKQEMAALLKKYNVEISIREKRSDFSYGVEGIDFELGQPYYSCLNLSTNLDHSDFE